MAANPTIAIPCELLDRQCEIIQQAEEFVAAARASAAMAEDAEGLDLLRLPMLTTATEQALLAQAQAFESWGARVASFDVLLGRTLRQLAAALRDAAGRATEAAVRAEDFATDYR